MVMALMGAFANLAYGIIDASKGTPLSRGRLNANGNGNRVCWVLELAHSPEEGET